MGVMAADSPPLDGLDLNLLVTLRALLTECSVTRAAERIGQSQPTVSRALQALRTTFGDELLTRSGRAMTRTPLGDAVLQPLHRFLHAANRLATIGTFDPATAQRRFHISLPDLASAVVVPRLARGLVEDAPGCTLFVGGGERDQLAGVLQGDIDLAVGPPLDHPELCRRALPLGTETWTVLVGPAHSSYGGKLDLQTWLDSPHLQVVPHGRPRAPSSVDSRLRELGLARHVALQIGQVAAVADTLATSTMVTSLPRAMAQSVARDRDLQIHDHPLGDELSIPTLYMSWHESMQRDAGHTWMRERLIAAYEP